MNKNLKKYLSITLAGLMLSALPTAIFAKTDPLTGKEIKDERDYNYRRQWYNRDYDWDSYLRDHNYRYYGDYRDYYYRDRYYNNDFSNVSYSDKKISGRTAPNVDVYIYNGYENIRLGKSDSDGYFDFSLSRSLDRDAYLYARDNYRESSRYYIYGSNYSYLREKDTKRVYPTGISTKSYEVSGRLSDYVNTKVSVYDGNYYLGTTTTDKDGYFTLKTDRYIDSRSYLEFYTDGKKSESKTETSNEFSVVPVITSEVKDGASSISGVAGKDAKISVFDGVNKNIGEATASSSGSFSVSLTKSVVGGEKLTIKATESGKKESSTVYEVKGGVVNKPAVTTNKYFVLTIGSKSYTDNNGKAYTFDVAPTIKNSRTLLPMRAVAEMIGAEVEWNKDTRTATFTKGSKTASIQIDGNDIVINDKANGIENKLVTMDSKPLMVENRILLPITNIANIFSLTNGNTKDGINQDIEWNEDNRTVTINVK